MQVTNRTRRLCGGNGIAGSSMAWGLFLLGMMMLPGNINAQQVPKLSDPPQDNLANIAGILGELPNSLEDALGQAMAKNPGISTAKSKVELAESELNATRMDVTRKIVDLWNQRQAVTEVRNSARTSFEIVLAQRQSGNAGGEGTNLEKARITFIDANAKLAGIETELRYLLGQGIMKGAASASGNSPTFSTNASSSEAKNKSPARTAPAPIQMPRGDLVEKVRQDLLKTVTFDLRGVTFPEFKNVLQEDYKVPLQFDTIAFEEEGINMDTKFELVLKETPLFAAFQAFQDQFSYLVFVVRDYGVLLTSKSRAEEYGYMSAIEFARAAGNRQETVRPVMGPSARGGGAIPSAMPVPEAKKSNSDPFGQPGTVQPSTVPTVEAPQKPNENPPTEPGTR